MYCKNCGSNLDDRAVICPHCGVPTGENFHAPAKNDQTNVIAVVGFILSFFIAIAGLVCSIIGYKKASEMNGNGKGLALAGIIISVVSLASSIIALFVFLPVFIEFIATIIYGMFYINV